MLLIAGMIALLFLRPEHRSDNLTGICFNLCCLMWGTVIAREMESREVTALLPFWRLARSVTFWRLASCRTLDRAGWLFLAVGAALLAFGFATR